MMSTPFVTEVNQMINIGGDTKKLKPFVCSVLYFILIYLNQVDLIIV